MINVKQLREALERLPPEYDHKEVVVWTSDHTIHLGGPDQQPLMCVNFAQVVIEGHSMGEGR